MTAIASKIIKPKLTCHFLQQQNDWDEWNHAEFHQLNMYNAQEMFGKSEKPTPNTNILPLL